MEESRKRLAVKMESMKDWGVRMDLHRGLFDVLEPGHSRAILYLTRLGLGVEKAMRWSEDELLSGDLRSESEKILCYENKGSLEDLVATYVAVAMYYVFISDLDAIGEAHSVAKALSFYTGESVVEYTENGTGWTNEKWAGLFLEKAGLLRVVNSNETACMWLFDMIITGLTCADFFGFDLWKHLDIFMKYNSAVEFYEAPPAKLF